MTYGACGFNNNGIGIYTSADLSNTGWKLETLNALPAATRAVGEYWEPNMAYNPSTRKFVMWWIYSKPNTTLGVVQVGASVLCVVNPRPSRALPPPIASPRS